MKVLMMFAASAVSTALVLPTVTQAESRHGYEQVAGAETPAATARRG